MLVIVIDFNFRELISSLGPFYEALCRRRMDAAHHFLGVSPLAGPGLQKSLRGQQGRWG